MNAACQDYGVIIKSMNKAITKHSNGSPTKQVLTYCAVKPIANL
jgi:hypothetical protein